MGPFNVNLTRLLGDSNFRFLAEKTVVIVAVVIVGDNGYVAQAGPELTCLLPQSPTCWNPQTLESLQPSPHLLT